MTNLTSKDLLANLAKLAHRQTKQEILQAGINTIAATGLPLDGVESLARGVGLELEDIAFSLGMGNSTAHSHLSFQIDPICTRMIGEIHEMVVKRQASRLATLNPTERDLYDAADEQVALNAQKLCLRTRLHDLNSHTKQCLANLVKLGLLKKAAARQGYLRIPAQVMS